MGKGIRKGRSMSMDKSSSRRVKANSFNEDTFFTLWFYSINFCLSGADECRDDQGTANKKKVKKIGIVGANKLGTIRADVEEDLGTSGVDIEKDSGIDRADKPGTGRADVGKDPGKGGADKPGTGGADKLGKSGADKSGIGRLNKSDIGGVDKAEKQLAKR